MRPNTVTLLVFLIAPVLWLPWEFWLLRQRANGIMDGPRLVGTLSMVAMWRGSEWMTIPFVWSGLAGHFFIFRPSHWEIPGWFNAAFIIAATLVLLLDVACNLLGVTWFWRDPRLFAPLGFALGLTLFSQRL